MKEGIFAKHARILRGAAAGARRGAFGAAGPGGQRALGHWLQGRLRAALQQAFVRQFGPINLTSGAPPGRTRPRARRRETVRRPNLQPFLDDPDVLAGGVDRGVRRGERHGAEPGPVFSRAGDPSAGRAGDRLGRRRPGGDAARGRAGGSWPGWPSCWAGPARQALAELGEAVFLNPSPAPPRSFEAWETADAYLSGPVRTKLAVASAAAATDPRYAAQCGGPGAGAARRTSSRRRSPRGWGRRGSRSGWWNRSAAEVIGIATRVRHTVEVAVWSLDVDAFAGQAAATSEWGTARRHAGELLHDALNAAIPQIYDIWRDAEGEHRVLNAAETEAAKEKLGKIKASVRGAGCGPTWSAPSGWPASTMTASSAPLWRSRVEMKGVTFHPGVLVSLVTARLTGGGNPIRDHSRPRRP